MALRIRLDGRIFCAALNEAMEGDIYLHDGLHYQLSVEEKLLVTTPNDYHIKNGGEWWWKGREPKDMVIDSFYYEPEINLTDEKIEAGHKIAEKLFKEAYKPFLKK